jgi:serine/threonine protein kinase
MNPSENIPGLPSSEVFKIWIFLDHYIPVNRLGYVLGTCAEGSLGCVIQIVGPDARFALKIPRLLADTVRENAFIVQLTEQELTNVLRVGHLQGLVPANRLERAVLKHRRSGLADAIDEQAQQQDRNVILVSYEKERNPRFCSVKFDNGNLSIYPPDAQPKITAAMTGEIWDKLRAYEKGIYPEFDRSVFWSVEQQTFQSLSAGLIEKHDSALRHSNVWYAGLPAIIYDWAVGSLQEAIGKLHLKSWHYSDHFTLFEQLLDGLCSLHSRGMLHADIRPANVMCTERAQTAVASSTPELGDPRQYRLGDYGSFGDPDNIAVGAGDTGNTMMGPGVGSQRVTPFYSRERRAGVERESADTAIIQQLSPPESNEDDAGEFLIRLGWRTELLVPNTNEIRPEVLRKLREDRKRLIENEQTLRISSSDGLQKGDRLRLREYVFEVIQAGQVNEDLICRAKRKFARVIHDRLAVYDLRGEIAEPVVSLSNFIELRQWSAATDLYGIGAICLYTLFCTGIQKHGLPATVETGSRGVDSLFGDLISTLESVPHFRIFWAQLELFRSEFENFFAATPGASSSEIAEHETPSGKTLFQIATEATDQICQSAPHAKVILLQLERNLNHFVLFMHFIMSCLHRQTHLEDSSDNARFTPHVPFCKSRTEAVRDGAAGKASSRLLQLRRYHTQNQALEKFVVDPKSIQDFNPRPNVELLKDLSKTKEAFQNVVTKVQNVSQKWDDAKKRAWLPFGMLHMDALVKDLASVGVRQSAGDGEDVAEAGSTPVTSVKDSKNKL